MGTTRILTVGAVGLALLVVAGLGSRGHAGALKATRVTIKKRISDEIGWNVAGNGLALGRASIRSTGKGTLRVTVRVDAGKDDELENKGRLEVRTKQWYDEPGKPYSAEDRCDYWEDTSLKTNKEGRGRKTFTVLALNEDDGEVYVQVNVRRHIGPPVWTRPAYASKAGAVSLD